MIRWKKLYPYAEGAAVKKNETSVTLGDVIFKVLGNEDCSTTLRKYYIGGEHYESESIKIKTKGVIKDSCLGYQFHFPFEKNDTLFMTKNPRLKKAGIVDFSGICSIASFVLRTRDESVLREKFIPIIVQSDQFWNHLMRFQSGSVNPFIKWKTLSGYSFHLPDVLEQDQYVNIIWKLENLKEALEKQYDMLNQLIKSQFIEMFGDPETNSECWPIQKLITLSREGRMPYGVAASASEFDGTTRYIRITDIKDDGTLGDVFVSPDSYNECHVLKDNDLLFARTGSVGKTFLYKSEYGIAVFAGYLIKLTPNIECIDPVFLYYYTKTTFYEKYIESIKHGGVQANINAKQYGSLNVYLPPIEFQKIFSDFVKQVDKSKFELQQHIKNTKKLQKTIINEVFNDEKRQ